MFNQFVIVRKCEKSPKREIAKPITPTILDREELLFTKEFKGKPPNSESMWSKETLIAALVKNEIDEENSTCTISKRQFTEKVVEMGKSVYNDQSSIHRMFKQWEKTGMIPGSRGGRESEPG